ncbi:MAG: tetratricopeptide repeat protein [Treponema sp.]|jgi:Tfp pilus assembly protein PilF|nr:tetratricopeptide repeat protein [Treponema sp.]
MSPVDSGPENGETLQDLTVMAQDYFRQGKFLEALQVFTRVLKRDPQYVPAYNGLGTIYGALQKPAQACTLFRRGLALDPDNAALHYNYGMVLAAQGKLGPAAAAYQEALRCRPDWYKPANRLSMIRCKQGRYANALEVLNAILKYHPDNAEIQNTIQQVLAKQEAARQAAQENKKEVPLMDTNWDVKTESTVMVDLLKYLVVLAEYLPEAERERFMKSDTAASVYQIMGSVSTSSAHSTL